MVVLADDVSWKELSRSSASRQAGALGRGLLIALPLVAVFGALLVAADAVFQRLVGSAVPDPSGFFVSVGVVRTSRAPPPGSPSTSTTCVA